MYHWYFCPTHALSQNCCKKLNGQKRFMTEMPACKKMTGKSAIDTLLAQIVFQIAIFKGNLILKLITLLILTSTFVHGILTISTYKHSSPNWLSQFAITQKNNCQFLNLTKTKICLIFKPAQREAQCKGF